MYVLCTNNTKTKKKWKSTDRGATNSSSHTQQKKNTQKNGKAKNIRSFIYVHSGTSWFEVEDEDGGGFVLFAYYPRATVRMGVVLMMDGSLFFCLFYPHFLSLLLPPSASDLHSCTSTPTSCPPANTERFHWSKSTSYF